MPVPEWPADRTERLRTLWDEGVSTSEIGRRLGVSGNAVVGKSHRLGLEPRGSPLLPAGSGKRPFRRIAAPKPPPPLPLEPLPSVAATPAPRTPLPEHPARGQCEFIIGDPKGRHWRFCGDPCVLNARSLPSPYCANHLRLCTAGVPALRSVAA